MQLFYNPALTETTENFTFDREESKHIVKVLRKQEGDILHVTNGLGFIFTVQIVIGMDTKCQVRIISAERQKTLDYKLHLAVAPTKMNDRYEWFLEKATEIGVTSITPIICDRSEKKHIKSDRFEKIIQSAAKQSLQSYCPLLNDAISLKEFIKNNSKNGTLLIAHCEETAKKSLKSILKKGDEITLLIGPEGDFSDNEIKLAIENGYIPVTLGDTRLRTETAAIVGCHSVAFVNQD
ncbi:16S rRNA (uracil(1498)-N(3))-methyltransferase [Flavobacterium antarcticum]|uniref:16S rRNA (uracil(1498)-N(3))-methyltransferase n=1 Tax=Flavobacterium antarcticum TaxID=271155 RepID=UPI0003B38238|nr:16S rRNA (uracil(1498)-N(3))-methyltransferase [Flavobacterium antarcticum]